VGIILLKFAEVDSCVVVPSTVLLSCRGIFIISDNEREFTCVLLNDAVSNSHYRLSVVQPTCCQ
jgi:hypothetical protein